MKALLGDLHRESTIANGRVIESVFLGGGTPSLFSSTEIQALLDAVRGFFTLAENAEVTMEANPGTVECGAPAGYREAGVNRLSIGAQSFDNEMLSSLGRIHSSADIVRTVEDAKAGGFDNINIDLMHGLPGQTVNMALADLSIAINLEPAHISWYQLTLEPNTVFYARPPANLPDDDLAFEIQDRGQTLLVENGFLQYEVSAYARDGQRCQHNFNYWSFGDYLAVGAGAHGKLTISTNVHRYQKPANPLQYMVAQESAAGSSELTRLSRRDLIFEFMLNALRLNDGFAESTFVERTGLSIEDLRHATAAVVQKGLIERSAEGFWMPTALGSRFLNDLQSEFIVEHA